MLSGNGHPTLIPGVNGHIRVKGHEVGAMWGHEVKPGSKGQGDV